MDHGGESGTCWKQRRTHLASLAVREKPSEEDIRYPVPTILRLYVRSSSRHLRGSRSGQYSIVRQDWCPSTGRPTAHHRRASLPGHTAPDHRAIEHPTIRSLILPEEERRALEDRRALVWSTSSGPLRPFFPIPGSKHRAFVRNLPSPKFPHDSQTAYSPIARNISTTSLQRTIVYATMNTSATPVSYTHLRDHETKATLVCRLLLEKKKK